MSFKKQSPLKKYMCYGFAVVGVVSLALAVIHKLKANKAKKEGKTPPAAKFF